MNNTRVTRGEFKVFLKRVDTRETRIQDINAQVGNLDLQRYQAPRNEGVQDSKIMGIPRHITGNEDQSIPEDRYDELYQVLQEPEHIYENMKSERPLRGREFHVTGKRG